MRKSSWACAFFLTLWIEILIAQPIARKVMRTVHAKKEAKITANEGTGIAPNMQVNYLIDDSQAQNRHNRNKK